MGHTPMREAVKSAPGGRRRRRQRGLPYIVEAVPGRAVRIGLPTTSFLLDEEDWRRVSRARFFARRRDRINIWIDGKSMTLARYLTRPGANEVVDHINGDPTDNRRINLRICTPAENCFNMALNRRNSSGFKGVTLRVCGRFAAYAHANNKQIYLGLHPTAELAAQAHDAWARANRGRFACLNFPRAGEQSVHRREADR